MTQSEVIMEVLSTIVVHIEHDDCGFHAFCPALFGLHVGGDTRQEVIQNAEDAVYIYLQSMIQHGEQLPPWTIRTLKEAT